jgi:uncharacterized protein (DUF433 family)
MTLEPTAGIQGSINKNRRPGALRPVCEPLPTVAPVDRGVISHIMKDSIVSRDLEVMGGAAVFGGTRVPLQTLLDYLEAGESIDDFLEGFPSVTREQVIAFLEEAKTRVIEAAS